MELVIRNANLEDVPIRHEVEEEFIPGGILNSNYKKTAKANFLNPDPKSLFGIRNRVKNNLYFTSNSIETLLKVGIFATAIAFIL